MPWGIKPKQYIPALSIQEAYHVQLLQIDPTATMEMAMTMIIEEAAIVKDEESE